MKVERHVIRLVGAKAAKHLRTATALVAASMSLLACLLAVAQEQSLRNERDFDDNPALHFLRVSSGSLDSALSREEIDAILAVAANRSSSYAVAYEMGVGVPDDDGRDWFLVGVSGQAADRLGLRGLGYGTARRVGSGGGKIVLKVPVVEVADGGMTSAEQVPLVLELENEMARSAPVLLAHDFSHDSLFVNERTFASVVEAAFGAQWVSVKEGMADLPVSGEVHLWVDDIANLDSVSAELEERGWSTAYTARAFDDLAGSLGRAERASLGAVLLVAVVGLGIGLACLQSYLRLSRRDIGTLLVWGHSRGVVERAYRERLLVTVAVGLCGAWVGGLICGLVLHGDGRAMTINASVVGLLAIVVWAVCNSLLRSHAQAPVLDLLKVNREFD